jgi:hypothetical protein
MPVVFIVVAFPTILLAAVFSIMGLDLAGAAAVSIILLVMVLGVVFVSLAMTMYRQHPSQDGGDRRLSEDRFAPLENDLDRQAVPVEIANEINTPYGAIGRWTDDGAPADARESR